MERVWSVRDVVCGLVCSMEQGGSVRDVVCGLVCSIERVVVCQGCCLWSGMFHRTSVVC